MNALANHSFVKMNGIGNEIVVVDMRDSAAAISAEDARAVAQPSGAPRKLGIYIMDTKGAAESPAISAEVS